MDKIIELYKSNTPIVEIQKQLNVSMGSIYRALHKKGIPINKRGRIKRKTKVDYTEISNLYESGLISKDICDRFGISNATLYKALYSTGALKRGNIKKYTLNEDYFSIINTEDKAYFLGLLYADGCNNGSGFYITLQDRDIDILKIFKRYIGFNGELKLIKPIKDKVNNKAYYSLNISSKKVSKILSDIGCVKNKTVHGTFPTIIPDHLMNHFIRGMFDGDGSISLDKKNQLAFSIVGKTEIINIVASILNENCNTKVKTISPKRYKCDISIFSCGGNKQIKRLEDYLYNNATVYLERKKLKFKSNGN